jgi:tetratricopeptide (TPR) repeat protein
MKRIFLAALCVLTTAALGAETLVERIDRMHEDEMHRENYELLKRSVDSAGGAAERAELYWRLARTTLEVGDLLEQEGAGEAELLEKYLEGESYADLAIELDPNSHWGYYWKSANIGRWGETKGILNSLFKAKPMRNILSTALSINPEHADSFYVLGIMYRKVPGRPISFGSPDKAVSLGRKAVDAQEVQFRSGEDKKIKLSFHMELARSLYDRNWNESKREREQQKKERDYRKEQDALEKNFLYEGVVDIPDMSDREEAIQIMEWVIGEFDKRRPLSTSESVDLEEALTDLADWR